MACRPTFQACFGKRMATYTVQVKVCSLFMMKGPKREQGENGDLAMATRNMIKQNRFRIT
eukprot:967852-Amphidinium_carterae.1